jgi:hypothetical protein
MPTSKEMSSMTMTISTHTDEQAARRAARVLHATARAQGIRLLVGSPLRDVRREVVGGFAGPVAPDAPVGTFAGTPRLRRQGTGSFAGDPDEQRQGSFADSDRVVVVSPSDGRERTRITGHRGVRRLLRNEAVDDGAIERALDELRLGRVVVVAEVEDLLAEAA